MSVIVYFYAIFLGKELRTLMLRQQWASKFQLPRWLVSTIFFPINCIRWLVKWLTFPFRLPISRRVGSFLAAPFRAIGRGVKAVGNAGLVLRVLSWRLIRFVLFLPRLVARGIRAIFRAIGNVLRQMWRFTRFLFSGDAQASLNNAYPIRSYFEKLPKLLTWGLPLVGFIFFSFGGNLQLIKPEGEDSNMGGRIFALVVWYLALTIYSTSNQLIREKIDINRISGRFVRLRKWFYRLVQRVPILGKRK